MITARIKKGYGVIQRDIMTADISVYSKAVYCLLVSYAGDKEACFPSLNTMCTNLQISKPTVIKALKELINIKFLISDRRQATNGEFSCNVYYPMYIMEEAIVNDVNQGGNSNLLPVVNDVYTKNNNLNNNNEDNLSKDKSQAKLFETATKQPKNNVKNKETAREVFKVPELDDVIAFFKEKGHATEAAKFFNYYDSKGWMVGRSKMKKWKSAANNWILNTESKTTASQPAQIVLQ